MEISDRASSIGQWVMIGLVASYLVAAFFIAEIVGPYLGYELTTSLGLLVGVFAVHGAKILGDRVTWKIAYKEASSRASERSKLP